MKRNPIKKCGCAFERDGTMAIACPLHEAEIAKRVKAAKEKVMAKVRKSNPSRYKIDTAKYRRLGYDTVMRGEKAYPPSHIGSKNENAFYEGAGKASVDLMRSPRKNPSRPPVNSPAYIRRASERPPRRKPSRRLRKRRAINKGRRVFPNPSGFVIRALGNEGKPMYYTGQHFSTDQTPKRFTDSQKAFHLAQRLVSWFPILRKYQVAVVDARSKYPKR